MDINHNKPKYYLFDLPIIKNINGDLIWMEEMQHIPFEIKRSYFITNIHGNETAKRGGHAHKNLNQVLIAASGAFDVLIDDGENKNVINLNRPDQGLLLSSMIWRELSNFSRNVVCLVFASDLYTENDYIRNYDQFIQYTKRK